MALSGSFGVTGGGPQFTNTGAVDSQGRRSGDLGFTRFFGQGTPVQVQAKKPKLHDWWEQNGAQARTGIAGLEANLDQPKVDLFKQYAYNKGWYHKRQQSSSDDYIIIGKDGQLNEGHLVVNLKSEFEAGYRNYPYLDTIKYFNQESGKLTTEHSRYSITLEDTGGRWIGEECGSCGGSGRVTCSECDGDGEINCPDCYSRSRRRSTGYVDCEDCSGNGKQECTTCKGSGKVDEEDCADCDGDGENDCSNCEGDGEVTCSGCGGSGRVTCSECDGDGEINCPDCS